MALDGAPERAGAVLLVPSVLDEVLAGGGGDVEGDLEVGEALGHLGELEVHDAVHVLLAELLEDDDVREAVEELRLEGALGLVEDALLELLVVARRVDGGVEAHEGVPLQDVRPDVGGQDEDGVAEIDRAAERVGQAAVLQDLQEQLDDVRVGLLDLVEEHDGVGLAADLLGQLAALLVADVARGRADEAGDGELLHVLRHVDLDDRVGLAEHPLGEGAGEERLADAGGPEEEEGADGAARVLEVGAGAAEGAGHDLAGLVLADDRGLEVALEVEELLGLLALHAGEGDAGPVGHDGEDLVLADGDLGLVAAGLPGGEGLLALGAEPLLLVAQGGGLLELLAAGGVLLLRDGGVDGGLERLDLGREVEGADAGAGAGLVHDVDGLVGQVARGDVAVREADGLLEGGVGELALVVLLVLVADAAEDAHGVLGRGVVDLHRLEAALEGGVLLDVLAVLGERGRADALDLAAREGGLEDVGRVHRALGGAGADDGVDLVDEEDDVLGALDLVHHALDALLELAAVLGAGDHQRHVERHDLAVEQDLGDGAGGDLLGEALDDGRLADAGLADEDGVVLGAAAEDLHDAADLLLAPDHGVELASLGQLGEVAPEGLEQGEALAAALAAALGARGRLVLGGLAAVPVAVAGGTLVAALPFLGLDLGEDLLAAALDVDVELGEHLGGDALALAEEAEEDVLGADVGVAELGGLAAGVGEDLLHAGREREVVGGLRLLGPLADLLLDQVADALELDAHAAEDVDGDALPELDQPEQDVLGADVVVVEAAGLDAGQLDDPARPGREIAILVFVHGGDAPAWSVPSLPEVPAGRKRMREMGGLPLPRRAAAVL